MSIVGRPKKYKTKGKRGKPVGFSIQTELVERLNKFGPTGTVCRDIADEFLIVKEILVGTNATHPIETKDGSIFYGADLGNDTYHFILKKMDDTVINELSSVDIANLIVNLVGLLNNNRSTI